MSLIESMMKSQKSNKIKNEGFFSRDKEDWKDALKDILDDRYNAGVDLTDNEIVDACNIVCREMGYDVDHDTAYDWAWNYVENELLSKLTIPDVTEESLKEDASDDGVRKKQLRRNITTLVDEYINGIEDGDNEPFTSEDELIDFIYDQLFDFKAFGYGDYKYGKGICDDLKYLGKDYIAQEVVRIGRREGIFEDDFKDESLKEDTVKKSNGKWTNRGDDGKEHGEFDTKKEADAQRKAMYANGYKGESKKVVKESNYYGITTGDIQGIIGLLEDLVEMMDDAGIDYIQPSPNTYRMRKFVGTPEGYIDLNDIGQYVGDSEDYEEESVKKVVKESKVTDHDPGFVSLLVKNGLVNSAEEVEVEDDMIVSFGGKSWKVIKNNDSKWEIYNPINRSEYYVLD